MGIMLGRMHYNAPVGGVVDCISNLKQYINQCWNRQHKHK